MAKEHHYSTQLNWTGNRGDGTSDYKSYDRDHVLSAGGKPEIPASSDPKFRGNAERYKGKNVEQMGRILDLKIEWTEEVAPDDVASNLAAGKEDAMCFPLWPDGKNAAALDFTHPLSFMPVFAFARSDDARFDGDLNKANEQFKLALAIQGTSAQAREAAEHGVQLTSSVGVHENDH